MVLKNLGNMVDIGLATWFTNHMTTNTAATTIKSTNVKAIKSGDSIFLANGASPVDAFVAKVIIEGDKYTLETVVPGFDWVYRITHFAGDRVMKVVSR